MSVWRIQLKPEPASGISYGDVLNFCKKNSIIGAGWPLIKIKTSDANELRNEIYKSPYDNTRTYKAINALRRMETGDLIWTRLGKDASEYYLCRVGSKLWKDREITDEHIQHDICNYVEAKWIRIGSVDKVPGKVINSFRPRATAQRIYGIDNISMVIWNNLSNPNDYKYNVSDITKDDFWKVINSEELECLVLLYIQSKGYLVYSSTLKLSTAKFEVVMVSKDSDHHACPQIKSGQSLNLSDYVKNLDNNKDIIFLFTTSENYIGEPHPQVKCIKKRDIETFMDLNYNLLPKSITYILDWTRKYSHS
ncbi:MAG TPA: hypothetical protein PK761_01555 [Clostridia bacterium]|nr:hypothetical protein [Clostridia bacterium]HOR89135.1 hypothetical protein [Clostridia bacterium]HPL07575.1 hypothetical protein [Clostridia bacterium]